MNSDGPGKTMSGLNYVKFGLQAHYKSDKFPLAQTYEIVKIRVHDCPYPVYAIDDQSAVKVDGADIEIVGEGESVTFSPDA